MTDKSVVPEGMVAWAGGRKPQDWSGEAVQFRDGMIMRSEPGTVWKLGWDHGYGNGDIIAYTPRSNPLNLETSDLDPITPEEDALATAIIAAEGVTRQSLHGVVRILRAGLAKAGAVIVPVEPTEAMIKEGRETEFWDNATDVRAVYRAMLSAHSIQSGGEGGEGA